MTSPRVDAYRFGRIVIDGKAYSRDLIICPDHIVPNWWREQGHYLQASDLAAVLEQPPEVLVVGQGAVGRMAIAPEVAKMMADGGVELVAQRSGSACETYNQLRDKKRVALAIHLTC